jgi:large subunit ribosomal protein L10
MLKFILDDDQLDALATIKSREELIGTYCLLQTTQRVISALQNQFEVEAEAETEHNIKGV